MKGSLPQFLAKHVLALESADKDGWIGRRALVEALDSYMANSTHDGKAKIPCVRSAQNATMFSEARMADGGPQQLQLPPVAIQRVRKCYNCANGGVIQVTLLEIMVSIVIGLYQQRGLAHLCSMHALKRHQFWVMPHPLQLILTLSLVLGLKLLKLLPRLVSMQRRVFAVKLNLHLTLVCLRVCLLLSV